MDSEYEEAFRRMQERTAEIQGLRMTPRQWPMPEYVAKDWESNGLRCAVCRGTMSLCGYVLVPAEHPHANDHYDAPDVSVHGGLTFQQRDLTDGMWFGFDVGHCFDWVELPEAGILMPGTIWTVDEVAEETERLAEQLASQMA